MSLGTTAAIDVGPAATLIIAANARRQSFYLFNNGVNRIFLGETAAKATVADGFPIESFSQISEDRGENIYKGDLFGITAGTTEEMRYWERIHNG